MANGNGAVRGPFVLLLPQDERAGPLLILDGGYVRSALTRPSCADPIDRYRGDVIEWLSWR
jgi:hypothetical protein